VLLRPSDSERAFEVFLIERQRSMGFMGGMHVFPGGKVSQADASPAMHARIEDLANGAPAELWGQGMDAPAAIARAVAAIRETFEESGVLIGAGLSSVHLGAMRARLLGGEALAPLLEHFGARLRLSSLQPLARWITPVREPVRFDTSFYLARLPEGQVAQHEPAESASGVWLTPAAALHASRSGRIRLAPPTARTLESLSALATIDAAFQAALTRPLPVVTPVVRSQGGELLVLYPGDPEHPDSTPAFEGPTRHVLRRDM
jgi:8-oxo-dGTP pyrophosphatase MutT (NUDIX family)